MGARANRITRDEFVTPSELRGLGAVTDPAGRVGGARIELVRSGNETRLGACYQQVPVRVMPPFAFDSEPGVLLYLINLTAGLMDGDAHLVEIAVRPGAQAVVTGQSATRVHPALEGHATQQWSVRVEEGACLVVLPGPVIPFRGSRYFQRGRAELADDARLIWGDIWLAGRYARGRLSERYQFDRLVQDFEVRRANRLIYRERFHWQGPWTEDDVQWHVGGQLASASLFLCGPAMAIEHRSEPRLLRSVFALGDDRQCVRWCGSPVAVTEDLVQVALSAAATWTGGKHAPPWLLNSTGLAPNHWFSQSVAL